MWQTTGQPKLVDLLQRAEQLGSFSHAYLLVGPPHIGKMTLALDMAMSLNCQSEKAIHPCISCTSCKKIASGKHPDVQVVELGQNGEDEDSKEKKLIGIDQIDNMLHSAYLATFEGKQRCYIINEASNLSSVAANRLLKILEDPPARVTFILLTANIGLIPVTIVSRCQKLVLQRMKTAEIEALLREKRAIEPPRAKLLARLSRGCPGWAFETAQNDQFLEGRQESFEKMLALVKSGFSERFPAATQLASQYSKKRETVYATLESWVDWWRDILLVKTGCHADIVNIDFLAHFTEMARGLTLFQIKETILKIGQASQQLKINANSRLVLEALMLNIARPQVLKTSVPGLEVLNA
ncbi:MAG TPA: DNA polymerase III subunit [Dehalococcoidales bacterium]|nr:DNA polymerase III subunit [Dehalococcoidales bacterium]